MNSEDTQKEPILKGYSKEVLCALGRVTANWSFAEMALRMAVWSLASMEEPDGAALTTHMSFPNLRDASYALAKLNLDKQKSDEIVRLIGEIDKLSGVRNLLTHTFWIASPDDGTETIRTKSIKARGELQIAHKDWSAAELEEIANHIFTAGMNLVTYLMENELW